MDVVAQPILVVEGLSKSFRGLAALDSVSLDVRRGEILGLMGPNGAGKSVFINVVTGLYPPEDGTIRYRDRDITSLPSYALATLGIARTYQNIRLLRRMTVLENVLVAIKDHVNRPLRSVFARNQCGLVTAATSLLERAGQPIRLIGEVKLFPKQRRLARAVGTDNGHGLACSNFERASSQPADRTVRHSQAIYREHGCFMTSR